MSPVSTALAQDMTIDIVTTGWRSGRPRRIEIWFVRVDDRIYITGTVQRDAGGQLIERAWLKNLRNTPELRFCLKETVKADLPAKAREVTAMDERTQVLNAPATAWYRDNSDDLNDLIRHAPLVEIILDEQLA